MLKPTKISQNAGTAKRRVALRAGEQRQPVVQPGQQREGEGAGDHVVQVGDDEIGVVRLPVEGHDGEHHARQPAEHEDEEEAEDVEHRQIPARPAVRQRRQPGEDLHGSGHRNDGRAGREEGQRQMRDAHREHVVHPDAEAQEGQGHDGHDDHRVADQCAPREDRDQGGQHTGHRQEDDVDVGVPEQPEQVLPEQCVAAARGVEEGQAESALQLEQDRAEDQRREGHQHHQRGDQDVPAEDGHAFERHAGRAHLQDRHRDFDGEAQRRDLDEGHAQQPDVGVDARRVGVRTQRRVHEPAAVRAPRRASASRAGSTRRTGSTSSCRR